MSRPIDQSLVTLRIGPWRFGRRGVIVMLVLEVAGPLGLLLIPGIDALHVGLGLIAAMFAVAVVLGIRTVRGELRLMAVLRQAEMPADIAAYLAANAADAPAAGAPAPARHDPTPVFTGAGLYDPTGGLAW